MAKLPHLPLERVERTEDRRKVPAPVLPPTRPNPRGHGETIKSKVDAAVAEQTALPQIKGIDPELILKVSLAAPVQEDAWRLAGFNILAQEPNNILVVFSDDTELREFRARLAEYQKGPQGEQKAPSHNALLACIEEVGGIAPTDRIGPRLRSEGIASPGAIDAQEAYTVDIELWDAPTRQDREVRVQNVVTHIEGREGEVLSRYVGDVGLIVLRARLRGSLLRDVLALPLIACVDRPPIPDLGERDPPVVTLVDLPEPAHPDDDAPLIGIIDSGSTEHPLLVPSLQDSIGVPQSLGTADIWGHGTKVAGIAAFGDLRECVSTNTFASPVRIISAKVVNDQGQFDDTATIPAQMQEAILALNKRGCRVINIALGDRHRIPYDGGRVSQWAATLDTLARELDVVIIVSTGNSAGGDRAPWGPQAEHITQNYPDYLVGSANRIVDPATAAIALTVGSLAHANGLPTENLAGAELRAITSLNMPTPVTRCELATDQFALYRVPLPKDFQTTKGRRSIRVSLAFDPPVRHTRLEYLGLRLNYHLIRGMKPDDIFEHFRQRAKEEGQFIDLPGTAKCALEPSRDIRGTSTLQAATFKIARNIDRYGDDYYLVVFAERRWAGEEVTHQRFAVAVELEHEAQITIY